jgi:hypothetical protein
MAGENKRNRVAAAGGNSGGVIELGEIAELLADKNNEKNILHGGCTLLDIVHATGWGEKKTRALLHRAISAGICTPRKIGAINIIGNKYMTVAYDFHR